MLEQAALALQGQCVGLGGRQFTLHARHVQFGDVAGIKPALGELQRAAIGGHGALHQRVFGIQRTQRKVAAREFGLHQQVGITQQ